MNRGIAVLQTTALPLDYATKKKTWSERRDLNPRQLPWQGRALPLSYSRIYGSGNRTRTDDLRVMSPASYQLLHPAIKSILERETGLEPATTTLAR